MEPRIVTQIASRNRRKKAPLARAVTRIPPSRRPQRGFPSAQRGNPIPGRRAARIAGRGWPVRPVQTWMPPRCAGTCDAGDAGPFSVEDLREAGMQTQPTDVTDAPQRVESEGGAMLAVLVMVVLGLAGIFAVS